MVPTLRLETFADISTECFSHHHPDQDYNKS